MALGGAPRADAHTINLGLCPGACVAPAIDEPAPAKTHAASRITLSRSHASRTDRPSDPSPALVFERRTPPPILARGLASQPASAEAQAPRWVSPDYFGDVTDIPLPAGAWAEFAAASFFLFAPSFLDRLTFTDDLSADPLSGKFDPPPM